MLAAEGIQHTLLQVAIFQALIAGVLVLITGYYAIQTHRMVTEMKRARVLAVVPKIAIDLDFERAGMTRVEIRNVGQGPALDADLAVEFIPATGSEAEHVSRAWKPKLITPGEVHFFLPPTIPSAGFASDFERVDFRGTFRDSLGTMYRVEESIADLTARWDEERASGRMFSQGTIEQVVDALHEIHGVLQQIQGIAMGSPFGPPAVPVRHVPDRWPKTPNVPPEARSTDPEADG
jgi:hypothetical protein